MTVRKVVCWEGETNQLPGRKIEVGALWWGEDSIPVSSYSDVFNSIASRIGWATNLQREDDGSITAEFKWRADLAILDADLDLATFSSFCGDILSRVEGEDEIVTGGQILGVFVTDGGPWSRAWPSHV